MTFSQAIASGFQNYVKFSGRAERSEYWYWVLFAILVSVATYALDAVVFPESETGPINLLAGLALFLPGIAVGVRRLHDLDRTGWWFLIAFTIIGLVLLLVWACMKGSAGPNRFGPEPQTGQLMAPA